MTELDLDRDNELWLDRETERVVGKYGISHFAATVAVQIASSFLYTGRCNGVLLTPEEESSFVDEIARPKDPPPPLTPEEQAEEKARLALDAAVALASIGPGDRTEAVAEAKAEATIKTERSGLKS